MVATYVPCAATANQIVADPFSLGSALTDASPIRLASELLAICSSHILITAEHAFCLNAVEASQCRSHFTAGGAECTLKGAIPLVIKELLHLHGYCRTRPYGPPRIRA